MTLLRVISSRAKAPRGREESAVVIVTQFSRGHHSFPRCHWISWWERENTRERDERDDDDCLALRFWRQPVHYFTRQHSIAARSFVVRRFLSFLSCAFLVTGKFRILRNNGVAENVVSSMTFAFYEWQRLNRFVVKLWNGFWNSVFGQQNDSN